MQPNSSPSGVFMPLLVSACDEHLDAGTCDARKAGARA
jgi:hypothetical protein